MWKTRNDSIIVDTFYGCAAAHARVAGARARSIPTPIPTHIPTRYRPDTRYSQFKSHVRCNICATESTTFDPFNVRAMLVLGGGGWKFTWPVQVLSLPIPASDERVLRVHVVRGARRLCYDLI